jgi:hypothetical protein
MKEYTNESFLETMEVPAIHDNHTLIQFLGMTIILTILWVEEIGREGKGGEKECVKREDGLVSNANLLTAFCVF